MSIAANKSPFKFLDSFTEADRDIFFGREQEVEEVYAKVFQSKILLIYGASGTGKSSIINCGLSNKFMPSDWLQIPVRRGGNILSSMAQQINKFNLSAPLDNPARETGAKELKAALSSVFLDHFKPIYLVFDQFEELFIFGSKDEWTAFTETMRYLLDSDLELRFIFIIRGEYLEFLAEFEEMIPGFFDNRVRIEKMTRSKARESIIGPCHRAGIEVEDGVAENLLDKLSPGGGRVELTFLQVFLDKLYKQAIERTPTGESVRFTNEEVERLGQMSDVLAEFVDEQLFKMDNTKLATAVLKSFVSLQGTKVPLTMDQVKESLQKRDSTIDSSELSGILQSLVSKRILKDQDDEGRYELRHDSLAQKIFEKISLQEKERLEVEQFLMLSLKEYQKRGTYLSEDDLTYIAPHLRKLNLSKELSQFIELSRKRSNKQRRRRRNRAILTVVILLLSIASVVGFVYSNQQKQRADALAQEALEKSEEALRQKELAEEERQKAILNEQRAEEQAIIAEDQRQRAEEQSLIAEGQKSRAEREREAAVIASQRAELSEAEALKQSQMAQSEKERAEHLRILGLSRELAVRSARLTDPHIKTNLGLLAYRFNQQERGYPYQDEIYEALRRVSEVLNGEDAFLKWQESSSIGQILHTGSGILLTTGNNEIIQLNKNLETNSVFSGTNTSFDFMSFDDPSGYLLTASKKGQVELFNLNTGKSLWGLKNLGQVKAAELMNDIGLVAIATADGQITFFDLEGGLQHTLETEETISAAMFGELDQQLWVLTRTGGLIKVNLQSYDSEVVLQLPADVYTSAQFNNDGSTLAVGSNSGLIHLVDAKSGTLQAELPAHRAAITGLSFSQNGRILASGAFDRSARIWYLDHPQEAPIGIRDLPTWVSDVSFDKQDFVWLSTYDGKLYRFPAEASFIYEDLCEKDLEELSAEEWSEHVASDITKISVCDE